MTPAKSVCLGSFLLIKIPEDEQLIKKTNLFLIILDTGKSSRLQTLGSCLPTVIHGGVRAGKVQEGPEQLSASLVLLLLNTVRKMTLIDSCWQVLVSTSSIVSFHLSSQLHWRLVGKMWSLRAFPNSCDGTNFYLLFCIISLPFSLCPPLNIHTYKHRYGLTWTSNV